MVLTFYMDVEYSTEQMFKLFQNQLPSIVHRIIIPCFPLYHSDARGRHTGIQTANYSLLMTSVLTELFSHQVSGTMIPKLVKATYTYH